MPIWTAGRIDYSCSLNCLLHKARGIKPPLEVAIERFDWRNGWNDSWISTTAGNAYLQTLHHYVVKLNRGGAFRVTAVPAGDYELALKLYKRQDGNSIKAAATKIVRFSVSDADARQGVVDLGDVTLDAVPEAVARQAVSELEIELLDGANVRAADAAQSASENQRK